MNLRQAIIPGVGAVAALIADPSRALMLQALADARALPAGELARFAGVSPQTASTHLSRLLAGQLLVVHQQGRHRYYRLRDRRVAELLELMASLAPAAVAGSRPGADRATRNLRFARTCYKHLAGHVGVAITEALCTKGYLQEDNDGYELLPGGKQWFAAMEIDLHATHSGPLTRRCLDWSERRYHLGGSLGGALATRLLELQWLTRRREPRTLRLTERGRQMLRRELSLEFRDAMAF
jgi:DNA-binding transcriptional ArsR family regulator